MTQQSQPLATVIAFHGVQLALPASLPFTYQDNCLVLDFTLGYTGKLVIKPGNISICRCIALHLSSRPDSAVLLQSQRLLQLPCQLCM